MVVSASIEKACCSLASLMPGQQGRIAGVLGNSSIRHRLLEMGLTRGAVVELVRVAPLGDPVELQVRGYRLSVRKSEAEAVLVESV